MARFARPLLVELAGTWRVTASLAHVGRFEIVYVDQVDGDLFSSPRWEGRPLSLHASSPGKAVMAALAAGERRGMLGDSMLGDTLPRLTDTTITAMTDFDRELERVREQGFAVSCGEDVTYSNGASSVVTIDGRPVAAIDLWGPDRLVPVSRLGELGEAARAAASRLERALVEPDPPVHRP